MKFMIRLGATRLPEIEFYYPDPGPLPPLVPGEAAIVPSPGKSTRGQRRGKRGRVGTQARTDEPTGPRKH
jgi:hypothetical protein